MKAPHIYLVAGESSADALGGALMQSFRKIKPDCVLSGIGGEIMQQQGFASLFPYKELSIMGFWEIVPHIPKMLLRLRQTYKDIAQKRPDVVVTIDSPGFCFRLADRLKQSLKTADIPRIHYVAPSVWAYKPERAAKTAKLFQLLLALLPFEPPYFEKEGLKSLFIGHPVLWNTPKGEGAAFRKRHHIGDAQPILLLLPGSRKSEVLRHLDLFIKAAENLEEYFPIILAGAQVKDMIRELAPSAYIADIEEKYGAFAAANLALSKSGTVTLELAVARVPMVIGHKISPVSAWLIRRIASIKFVSLVNVAADKEIIPEFLQERCTLPELTQSLENLTQDAKIQTQLFASSAALQLLKGNFSENPSDVAARAIIDVISSTQL